MTDTRQPVLFLSHGAPPLADDARWTGELRRWGSSLAKPRNILMVSAHWEAQPVTLSSTVGAPLVRDFGGFAERYYHVPYDAPAAPDLAHDVARLLQPETDVHQDQSRGLDHGAYVPLVELFPDADVPVLQLSLPTLDPEGLLRLGERLAPLRDQGTLIMGSGFTTHNLSWFNPAGGPDYAAPQASQEFDAWAQETVSANDVDSLLDFREKAPAARIAHPRTEHWAPLYVALGASGADAARATPTVDGFWYGLSKRSWQFA